MNNYSKSSKKHTECTHAKKFVLISDKKAKKKKSKCAECLTDRTFLIRQMTSLI